MCIIIKACVKNWKDTQQIGASRLQKNQECVIVGVSRETVTLSKFYFLNLD